MFSLKILNSGKFLKMPLDTQNLYFHLALRADDDGVVEAYSVMRAIGSPEDNLKVLDSKGFIKILNEDLVAYITDWNEHNNIRADRKIDSIYQNLLIEILPDVELIEPKQRADRPKNKNGTSLGQPKDGVGKDRIDKDRIGKVKKGKDIDKSKIKHKYGEYNHVLLTDSQYEELKDKVDDREKWIKKIDESIEEKGNKYGIKNFKMAAIKWYKREQNNKKPERKIETFKAAKF